MSYCNANRFKVNDSKTNVLQIEANTADALIVNRQMIKIHGDNNQPIVASNNMKSLGFTLNARGTMDTHLSKMKARIGLEYSKLKPYLPHMSLDDRKIIVYSKMRSILDYGLPLYLGETEGLRRKLQAAYMTLNRIIHGGLGA